ncbi:MAG: HD domain-containing protein [Bacteroidales bacterium]|nr:HD domain-containing protein [Candidatus Equibacterium intestinale]
MTEKILRAAEIAFTAHQGQTDKAGRPYFLHPLTVARKAARNGAGEEAVIAALLHDVVEDTDWTFEMLEAEGFPEESMDALKLLTHDKCVPYMDYILPIKANPVARAVKLADLTHNMDQSRLPEITEADEMRHQKYLKAYAYLTGE